MKILVIPDVHLKPWIFDRASEIMDSGIADKALCLMDIPDDWGKARDLQLYEETYDAAIRLQKKHPETLWCYGNHDLSYEWGQAESGFSSAAILTVRRKQNELRTAIADKNQIAYIHRIDDVLFLHGGLTEFFVKNYIPNDVHGDADEVIRIINGLGCNEMWDEVSPIWYRPQFYNFKMYGEDDYLQVVGHTPVIEIDRSGNVLSCDLFSAYRNGDPIGTQEYLLIDTETWEYKGIR